MQSNVAEILQAAEAVEEINKATAREFREADQYPLFYCGGRMLPEGKNEVKDGSAKVYDQDRQYINHIYVEAVTGDDADTNYSDYDKVEELTDRFLNELLKSPEWKLDSDEQYPAKMPGCNVIVSEIIVSKFSTKKYG